MGAIDDVLEFWFGPKDAPDFGEMRAIWFRSTQAFDAEFEARFADAHRRAGAGELDDWMASPAGCLALIVLLDQYPRNVFRGTARAYATDATARAVAKHALEKGFERGLNGVERIFALCPVRAQRGPRRPGPLGGLVRLSRHGDGVPLGEGALRDRYPVRPLPAPERRPGAHEHARGAGISEDGEILGTGLSGGARMTKRQIS